MTVGEIAQFCTETVGDTSSELQDYAKRAIRLKYQTLYDAHAWRESFRVLDGVGVDPALGGSVFLPYDAEEVIYLALSYDGLSYSRLDYRERDWIDRFGSGAMTLPGNAPYFYRAENLAWPYLNPGRFTFTTSDQSPINVYIAGKDSNGFPVSESFVLTAAPSVPSSVSTSNNYSLVTTISKTGGTLSVQADFPASPIVLSSGAPDLIFTQVVLYPLPRFFDQNNNPLSLAVRLQVKLKADTLDDDMSVPRISHVWDALIEFTMSALYKRTRQLAKAQMSEQAAMSHVQAAVNVEKNQSESRQQVVPTTYERGNYLDLNGWYEPTSMDPFGGYG
jgi:hypothetical protein